MATTTSTEDSRPLYAQIRETLVERIRSGKWKPGQVIPNEFEIAAEFNVSQGTARKAIDALAADQLVVRRQGRGTFVVEHTPANVLFRFFNIFSDDGAQILPAGQATPCTTGPANPQEAKALGIDTGTAVIRVERVRRREQEPFIAETITLPSALFPGLAARPSLPNTLYDLFQRDFGIMVTRADERVTAVAATTREVKVLGSAFGAPLLRIERIAFGIDGMAVEFRVSICKLDGAHYVTRLK